MSTRGSGFVAIVFPLLSRSAVIVSDFRKLCSNSNQLTKLGARPIILGPGGAAKTDPIPIQVLGGPSSSSEVVSCIFPQAEGTWPFI